MKEADLKKLILKYTLQNAVFYKGNANESAVLGKILANQSQLRKNVAHVKSAISPIIEEVNKLTITEQKKKLEGLDSKMLKKDVKEQKTLPELPHAKKGKVVTRFAPAPTGPLNIAHTLRAVFINYEYAKMYKGKFLLRFEDTDPSKVEKKFYDWIKEDLEFLNVKPDKIIIQSDHMHEYYKIAEKLIKEGKFYVCICKQYQFKKLKEEKKECKCRKSDSLDMWKKMLLGKIEEGHAVVRLKTSMSNPNPAIRDPAMLRINFEKHPLKGNKYPIWPLYNFAVTIEDHKSNVTHVFRGKEHEHNTEIQKILYKELGWEQPYSINFGMIYFPGEKLHTRDIKEMIEKKEVTGWDDPKLKTVRALLRRGFRPEAFRECALGCGLSKTDIKFEFEKLENANRRIIDSMANRYMVVIKPIEIGIKRLLKETGMKSSGVLNVQKHPEKSDIRKIPLGNKIYVSEKDFKKFKNKEVRLIELFNIILKKNPKLDKEYDKFTVKTPKIHWVSEHKVNVKIIMPDKNIEAYGEKSMSDLKVGDIIQMIRFGFGRVERVSSKEVIIVFAHK